MYNVVDNMKFMKKHNIVNIQGLSNVSKYFQSVCIVRSPQSQSQLARKWEIGEYANDIQSA